MKKPEENFGQPQSNKEAQTYNLMEKHKVHGFMLSNEEGQGQAAANHGC